MTLGEEKAVEDHYERTMALARAVGAERKFKDVEELESVAANALCLAVRSWFHQTRTEPIWNFIETEVRRDIANHIEKDERYQKEKQG